MKLVMHYWRKGNRQAPKAKIRQQNLKTSKNWYFNKVCQICCCWLRGRHVTLFIWLNIRDKLCTVEILGSLSTTKLMICRNLSSYPRHISFISLFIYGTKGKNLAGKQMRISWSLNLSIWRESSTLLANEMCNFKECLQFFDEYQAYAFVIRGNRRYRGWQWQHLP